MYKKYIKRLLDIVLSGIGIAILIIPMIIIACVIKIEDPGPALFKQSRIGKNKRCFTLYKFRTMKLSTPHDIPTHLLSNPTQYLLKCGKVFRKLSIDELPQLFNIFKGEMSVIGPRPALWNQNDLIAERDKYGANDVRPGLTGWAQINGRDELEIPVKAKLDGAYVEALNAKRWKGFMMDVRCFIGTFVSVLRSDGVVEGGTGELNRKEKEGK